MAAVANVVMPRDARSFGLSGTSFTPKDEENAIDMMISFQEGDPNRSNPRTARSMRFMFDIPRLVEDMNVIVMGILDRELHPINRIVFPTYITESKEFRTHTLEYLASLPVPNPALATNRGFRKVLTDRTSRVERYGTHFMIEGDFARTPEGKADIAMSLEYIAGMTSALMAILAIERAFLKGGVPATAPTDADDYLRQLEDTAFLSFLPHKSRTGVVQFFDLCISKFMLQSRGIRPDVCIFPMSKISVLKSNPQFVSYDKAGPDGPARLWGDKVIGEISKVKLIASPDLPGEDRESQDHFMKRYAHFGEFVKLNRYPDMANGDLRFEMLDIHTDRYEQISIEAILDKFVADGIFTGDNTAGYKVKAKADFAERDDSPFKDVKYSTAMSVEDWEKAFDFIAFRPMVGLRTCGVVFALAGKQTGVSVMSPSNLEMGQDVGNKSHLVNWTGDAGIHIANPRYLMPVHDVFYDGVLHGGNTGLITKKQAADIKKAQFVLGNKTDASVYIFIVEKGRTLSSPVLPITGEDGFNTGKEYFSHAKFWNKYYSLDNVTRYVGKDGNMSSHVSIMCWEGSVGYNTTTGMRYRYGKTQHGSKEGPGVGDIRNRGLTILPEEYLMP
jgi:hypothetical protein